MSLLAKSKITPRRSGNGLPRTLCALLLLSALVKHAFAQEVSPQHDHVVTPLADLLQEAEKNNPQVEAARQGWQAAKQVPTQVSTLPDPQFTLQHLSVGSPRPFAGYANSDFAYIGLGVTQDIPYPGKLKLRGEIARKPSICSSRESGSTGHRAWNRSTACFADPWSWRTYSRRTAKAGSRRPPAPGM